MLEPFSEAMSVLFDADPLAPVVQLQAFALGILEHLPRDLSPHLSAAIPAELAEQAVCEAQRRAEAFLRLHPVPLALVKNGVATLPKGMPAAVEQFIREAVRDKRRTLTRGRTHVMLWRRVFGQERYVFVEVKREQVDLVLHAQGRFLASDLGRRALASLATAVEGRVRNSKSTARVLERMWSNLPPEERGRDVLVHLTRDGRVAFAASTLTAGEIELKRCTQCGDAYAPRDRQDQGRCPDCGNAARQRAHRHRAKSANNADRVKHEAMHRRSIKRGASRPDESKREGEREWELEPDATPMLDDFDSDAAVEALAEMSERRGEKRRAAALRGIVKKGVT